MFIFWEMYIFTCIFSFLIDIFREKFFYKSVHSWTCIHCILCMWLTISSQLLVNNGTKYNILPCVKNRKAKYQCSLFMWLSLIWSRSVWICRNPFITNVLYIVKWLSQILPLWYSNFNIFQKVFLCPFDISEIFYEANIKISLST